jgi:hypothetical protein
MAQGYRLPAIWAMRRLEYPALLSSATTPVDAVDGADFLALNVLTVEKKDGAR